MLLTGAAPAEAAVAALVRRVGSPPGDRRLLRTPRCKLLQFGHADRGEGLPQAAAAAVIRYLPGWAASGGAGGVTDFVMSTAAELPAVLAARDSRQPVAPPPGSGLPAVSGSSLAAYQPMGRGRRRQPVAGLAPGVGVLPCRVFFSQHPVGIGGWWSDGPDPSASTVHWFSEEVAPDVCPCLFRGGAGTVRPAGASSLAVELLAALALIVGRTAGLPKARPRRGLSFCLTGVTDNKGQAYVLHKLATPSQPGAAILQVLAQFLDRSGILARATWRPRGLNTWADQLSKGALSGFNPELRWRVPKTLLRRVQRWPGVKNKGSP